MPSPLVNVAIVGLGHIGKYHIRAIRQFEELNLLAVCDRREEFQEIVPEGVDFYTDHQEMLDDERIETVIIATPNQTHYSIARSILEHGRHIILEKPAAVSMEELETLQRISGEKNVTIYYAFHAASAFDVEWFASYYAKPENRKKLGSITGFLCRFYDPYVVNGKLLPEAEGLQDPWLDSGINAISVIQRFVDVKGLTIENVSAAINNGSPGYLQCHAEFSFQVDENDRAGLGVIDTNWTTGRNHKSTLLSFARTGYLVRIDHSSQRVICRNPEGHEEVLENLSGGQERLYNHYLGVFKDYLDHRKHGQMNGTEAWNAHSLLFAVEKRINDAL